MFCNSKNDADEKTPNVNVCPICMGHPGTLPVINKKAVEHVLRVGTSIGGEIADFSYLDRLSTYSSVVSLEQTNRRLLLHDLMIAEGFAPFYGEWWHFAYGDREWATFYHLSEALYSPVFCDDLYRS